MKDKVKLTPYQNSIIESLKESPKGISDLAKMLFTSKESIRVIIHSLRNKGFVITHPKMKYDPITRKSIPQKYTLVESVSHEKEDD